MFNLPLPPPQAGAVLVSIFHTHPARTGDSVYGCTSPTGKPIYGQTLGDGKLPATAIPDRNGGGSTADWTAADNSGFPFYVINKSGRVYKLVSGTPAAQRDSNPNKWEWKSPPIAGCMSKLP